MTAQRTNTRHSRSIVERLSAGSHSLSSRFDTFAFRGQLGPTRADESRDFRPARRR
jgi:hypothetical protein